VKLPTLLFVAAALTAPTVAHADATSDALAKLIDAAMTSGVPPAGTHVPRAIIAGSPYVVVGDSWKKQDANMFEAKITSKVIGMTADKGAIWIAADIAVMQPCGGLDGCVGAAAGETDYVTMLVDAGKPLQPVALSVATPFPDSDAFKKKLAPITRAIDPDAAVPAKQAEATLGDPAAFAATVSDRKEVVLYGSNKEKSVGGAAVKAKLLAWNLAFKVRDGVRAGVSANKDVAWVMVNVDTVPAKKPTAKPIPYRAMLFYELTGTDWKLVSAQFSVAW
jgi:hypothetical protein